MDNFFALLSTRLALFFAILLSPYLLVRNMAPALNRPTLASMVGVVSLALNPMILWLLHTLDITITALNLSLFHGALFLLLLSITIVRRQNLRLPPPETDHFPFFLLTAFCLFVFPFSYLPGMDTYKWQDLASSVLMEQCIPWLSHPLSIAGFGPRAYPSIQPLFLATIHVLGRPGVDGGYFILSLISGMTGICAAYMLGNRILRCKTNANWFTFLYVFSPIFLRYNHWATGRGVFLALLPLFVLSFLDLPRFSAVLSLLITGLLLTLTHKAGIIILILVPLALLLPLLFVRKTTRHPGAVTLAYILPFALFAVALTPTRVLHGVPGALLGLLHTATVRMGILAPLAFMGLWTFRPLRHDNMWQRIFSFALLTLPLAFADMYGAMLFLPFLALIATAGTIRLTKEPSTSARRLSFSIIAIVLLQSATLIVYRSYTATPPRIRAAARFLEQYDPTGPYTIHAPERVRTQIQAYVSGCPRFRMDTTKRARHYERFPSFHDSPRRLFKNWIAYARRSLSFKATQTDWYGIAPRQYDVRVDQKDIQTPPGKPIYNTNGITIYLSRINKDES